MNERANGDEQPNQEAIDTTFSEIVADLEAEWAANPSEETDQKKQNSVAPSSKSDDHGWRSAERPWEEILLGNDPASDDEHYLPPEPPRIPRMSAVTVLLILLILAGLLLVIAPRLLGFSEDLGLIFGITGVALGLILLLLRVRHNLSDDADPTNGAQV